MTGEPQFPLERAFVVQLRRDATLPSAVCGRIEHIVSGRACRFESVAELASFVERTLGSLADVQPESGRGDAPGTSTRRDGES